MKTRCLLVLSALLLLLEAHAPAFYDPGTGRWLSKDPVEEAGGENLYNFVNNSPIDRIDPLGLTKYTIDKKKCLLHVRMTWHVTFTQDPSHMHIWTKREKNRWLNKARNTVEDYYSNLKFRCYPDDACLICPCSREGIKVRFDLSYVNSNADVDVDVVWGSRRSTASKPPGPQVGHFDSEDFQNGPFPTRMGTFGPNVPIVHETGHLLGLDHPGFPVPRLPGDTDYDGDPTSLMGYGTELRIKDFNIAFCDHVHEDTSLSLECQKWQGR